ncbi:MAG TPA: TolC family protein, partial [Lentimicrobium sp.]|nr:TolC family protein [Lentimicrobium sp.]
EIHRIQKEALHTRQLPQMNFNGQASWQSDVTELPIRLPGLDIPEIAHDQYKIWAEVSQLVWDGGSINRQMVNDRIDMLIHINAVEVENYRLLENVNQIYFSILSLRENEKLLRAAMDELYARLKNVRAGIENGTMLPSNAAVLDAEITGIEQMLTETGYNQTMALYRLEELCGLENVRYAELEMPYYEELPAPDTGGRPEYESFLLEKRRLSGIQELNRLSRRPWISAYSSIGYGRPGLNMLSNDFEPYALLGARLSWNIHDWGKMKKQEEILVLQEQIVDTRLETYERNQRIALQTLRQEVSKIEHLIAADHRIISLRKQTAAAASARLDQGIITSSEYLTDYNALLRAELNLSLNRIRLEQVKLNYISTSGLLNNLTKTTEK